MPDTRLLYDLAAADPDVRLSPNCWRTRFALAHKNLPVETVPWRFHEKDAIAQSGQGKVPVLVEGGRWLSESWDIAEYLEDTYPDRPSLFGGAVGRHLARFVNLWVSQSLHPAVARVILPELLTILDEQDKDYFRRTREQAFGKSIEDLAAERDASLAALRQVAKPLRSTLSAQSFLAGDAPLYPDHVAFSAFVWARASSDVQLFEADDPIAAWCERMLDAYDGLARQVPKFEDIRKAA